MARNLLLALAVLVAGCAPRANLDIVTTDPGIGSDLSVFVATNRAQVGPAQFAETARGSLSFMEYTVSVPPEHDPGIVELARRNADPERHFVTRDAAPLDRASFRSGLSRAFAENGSREVFVYVHGFNNNVADPVYRASQMKTDLALSAVPVAFAWPSAASPFGYVRDRDSALFARAALAGLLDEIAALNAEIILVPHSMGSLLTMETLIWIKQAGDRRTLDAIQGVVMLSPDIDVEVFRAQAAAFGPLPQPFFIFTSERDPALRLSARLTGETDRLGNIEGIERVADLDVALIDLTAVEDSASRHLAALTSPTMITFLRQAAQLDDTFERDPSARAGLLPGTVLTVQNATQVVVSPFAD
ncbi:MAG: alpha/beta hydrolase [Pseudomonadota bacterium]